MYRINMHNQMHIINAYIIKCINSAEDRGGRRAEPI